MHSFCWPNRPARALALPVPRYIVRFLALALLFVLGTQKATAETSNPAMPSAQPTTAAPAQPTQAGQTMSAAPATSRSGMRTGTIVATAVGVASITTGILLNLKANSLASDLQTSPTFHQGEASTRPTYVTFAWVGYGVGTACLAGGAFLYYLAYRQNHKAASSLTLLPATSPGFMGTVLHGSF